MSSQDTAPLVVSGKEVTPVPGGTVEVTAPADLKEGYVLSVEVGGTVRSVIVPAGGVTEGQVFQAEPTDALANGSSDHFIPTGNWRDGLCACCRFGCCHAVFCMGWCVTPILNAQVMTRMSRNWLGGPGRRPSASNTCFIVTGLFVLVTNDVTIFRILMSSGHCLGGHVEGDYFKCPDGTQEPLNPNDAYLNMAVVIISSLFSLYMIIIICRTRAAMRAKYNIAAGRCGFCEDCCCAVCCSCLTVQQMARHTNDYATYDVKCCGSTPFTRVCCNKRGQQESVPEIEIDP